MVIIQETRSEHALQALALILSNLTPAFADSAEVGTSFSDTRRVVFWSIFAVACGVVAILLAVPAGTLFQFAAPPLPVLMLAIAAGPDAGSWFGVGRADLVAGTGEVTAIPPSTR
jgi:zinc transporter ZupT